MLDRSRALLLAWSLGLLVLLAVLALGVTAEWSWLVDLDDRGRSARQWRSDDPTVLDVLRVVEAVFSPIGLTLYTAALAIAMFVKSHRRAALLTVIAMAAVSVLTTTLKTLVSRERPDWQHPEALLTNGSFPSGHASGSTALATVVVVLVTIFVRRQGVRRLLTALAVLGVVLVGLDRVLLGRHYPTDVAGGVLLGVLVVLLSVAAYDPLPRSHAAKSEPLPQVGPTSRDLAVVLNPIKVEDVAAFQATVRQLAAAAGWGEPTWHLTTPEDSGTGQAEAASVSGADLVIVCGGDGTVREVCAELAGTGIPVGIVPAGTGNLLARNLEIPLYIRAAIDIALTGQDRAIDMVKVHGDAGRDDTDGDDQDEPLDEHAVESHFMVMAGMGFDAAIMEGVNEDIKKRVGWLAYVLSGLRSLMFPPTRVEISIDGGDWTKHRARTVLVGNVGYLQAGMPLLPDAAIDDGLLDVVLLYPRRFLSWIPLAFRVLAKRTRIDDTINRMTGRTVSIRAAVDIPRQLDGDSIGAGRVLHMECIQGRLLVRVPR